MSHLLEQSYPAGLHNGRPRGSAAVKAESTELLARSFAALAIVGIALIHILNAPEAYDSARYIFWLYMALVAAAVPLVTMLLHSRSPLIWLASAAFGFAPFVAYLLSRSIGLPGDSGDVGAWINPLGITSLFVEASLVTLSVTRLAIRLEENGFASIRLPLTRFTIGPVPGRSLLGVLAAAAAIAAGLAGLSSGVAAASGTQVLHLSARAHMVLRFNTSHLSAHAGRITIIMRNPLNSGMRHGIALRGRGIKKVGRIVNPGKSTSITMTLRKGSYTYYCPVPGHAAAGMRGTLSVS